MDTDAARDTTEAGDPAPAKPRYDELSVKNASWTHKLAKSVEHYLKGSSELPEDGEAPGNELNVLYISCIHACCSLQVSRQKDILRRLKLHGQKRRKR